MSVPSQDAYGRSIDFSTDGTTDTYLIGGSISFYFPAGTLTAVALLSIAIKTNLSQFQFAMKTFVKSRYDEDVRFNFIALYVNAQANSLTNRLAYVAQLLTWETSVISYASTYVTSVKALTDPSVVASTQWDFSSLIASDPLVNPLDAVAILN